MFCRLHTKLWCFKINIDLHIILTKSYYYVNYNINYLFHSKILIESDANFQSPHSLALFEDHIYFLVANTFKLSRCLLYSTKTCEPFFYRIFDANLFVLNHESAQRGDVKNSCEGSTCDGVCVLGQEGPQCVCQNGRLSVDGKDCDVVEKELVSLLFVLYFNC